MPTDSVQLAPAAGSGVGKILADQLLADPEFLALLKGAFMDGLKAESFFYDKHAKEWHGEPDYKTRLHAATQLLAHMEGDPIKRIIHQHLGNGTAPDLLAAVEASPALAESMARLLEKARSRSARTAQAEPAAIEVD
jgi:hypothetical protein